MLGVPTEVTANHELRRIATIMSNGYKHRARFPHESFMLYIRQVYDVAIRQREEVRREEASVSDVKKKRAKPVMDVDTAFLMHLETYLTEANGRVPQSATPDEIVELLAETKILIERHGLIPVVSTLLVYERAAFDTF